MMLDRIRPLGVLGVVWLQAAIILLAACAQASPTPTQTPVSDIRVSPTSGPTFTATAAPTVEPALTPTPSTTLIPYVSPDWFEDDILYEIFVRSYADSDGNGVGDLKGITGRLDYIQSLGVDTLWLMPVYPSPSDHGYDVADYLDINPDYGSMKDFKELVAAVHARDMRIIIDFVPSHLSNQNPLFQNAYQNPDSEYSDWFVWLNDAHTSYAGFADNEEMPRFNHYNPEVVAYLSDAALHWLDLDSDGDYSDGVDGFRVDNITFPPREFLVALRQAIKQTNPDALLLGEAWVHNPSDMSQFFPDQFDALFDFPLYELMQGSQDTNGDGMLAGKGLPILITSLFEAEARSFPAEAIPLRFLSNHDTNRIANELRAEPARQRLAAQLVASLPGPVMLYYGEEIGMPGQKGGAPYYDNYRREPMDWYTQEDGPDQTSWFMQPDRWNKPADGISVEEQENQPDSLLNYYRTVLEIRHSTPALTHGDLSLLELEVSSPGGWGFVRSKDGQSLAAVYNFSANPIDVTIKEFPFTSEALKDLLSGRVYPGTASGEPYTLTLLPASAIWLVESQP